MFQLISEFVCNVVSIFGKSTLARRRRSSCARFSSEQLEARCLLSISAIVQSFSHKVDDVVAEAGEEDQSLSLFSIASGRDLGFAEVDGFVVVSELDNLGDYVSSLTVWSNADGNLSTGPNGCEEKLQKVPVSYGDAYVVFDSLPQTVVGREGRQRSHVSGRAMRHAPRFLITGNIREDPPGGQIVLDAEVRVSQIWSGMEVPQSAMEYRGDLLEVEVVPWEPATISIVQQSTGTSSVAVANQQDIVLLRFEATAAEADLFLAGVATTVIGDSSNGTNYSLWVDEDSDGNMDTALVGDVVAHGDHVVFSEIAGGGYMIPEGETISFEARTDVASSLTANSNIMLELAEFAVETFDDGASLSGEQWNGVGPEDSQIFVSTIQSEEWRFEQSGVLIVEPNSAQAPPQYYLAGERGNAVLVLDLTAVFEPITVTNIVVVDMAMSTSVERLQVFRATSVQPFATATRSVIDLPDLGGTNYQMVTLNDEFVIGAGQREVILFAPQIKSDEFGAVSGEEIQFSFNNSTGMVRARGLISGNDAEIISRFVTGTVGQVVLAKPASVKNVSTDPDGSAVPVDNHVEVFRGRITAAENVNYRNGQNDVDIETLVFEIDVSNVGIGTTSTLFTLSNAMNPIVTLSPSELRMVNENLLRLTFDGVSDAIMAGVDSGESETFSLGMRILGIQDSSQAASLQASLNLIDSVFSDGETDFFGFGLPYESVAGPRYQS
jgi:hypothetical protein